MAGAGMIVVAAGLMTVYVTGLLYLAMPNEDGSGRDRPIRKPYFRDTLYAMGGGLAVAGVGTGWVVWVQKRKNQRDNHIRQLERQRAQLTSTMSSAAPAPSGARVDVAPMLSPQVQGVLVSLRF